MAFDGDGDRSMFMSGSGRLIDGDAVLLLMARRLKKLGQLNPPIVVGTLMTNFSLERMLRDEGITLTRVGVGDRFIFEEMQRSGALLGGEPSGHVIFSGFQTVGRRSADDAESGGSDRKRSRLVRRSDARLDRSAAAAEEHSRARKGSARNAAGSSGEDDEVHHELQGCGRLVVRYSGTEPLLRVMIESDDATKNERLMEELLNVIREFGMSLERGRCAA